MKLKDVWRRWRDESGVALLLALGVLALLVVLTMSFAAASLNAKRMSELTDALTKSRQYSEAGLQQLVSMLKTDLTDHTDLRNLYPASRVMVAGTGAWSDYYFMVSARDMSDTHYMNDGLAEALNYSVDSFDLIPNSLPNLDSNMGASWLPVFESREMNGQNVQVMSGRIAFVLLDESGKVDPNVAINAAGIAEGSEPVRGENMSEIDLTEIGVASGFASALKSNSPGEWFSRYHIIRSINVAQSDVDDLNKVLFPYRRGDTLDGQSSLYNIRAVGLDVTAEQLVDSVPWFANWVEFGNFSTAEARAKNIAANIIDYTDSNRNATRDNDTTPTYFGTEKVPYLSRMVFQVYNNSHNDQNNNKTEPELRIFCMPELINMHGDLTGYATSCYIEVKLDVTWTAADGNQKNEDLMYGFDFNPADPLVYGDFSSNGYVWSDTGVALTTVIKPFNTPNQFTASDIKLKVEYMRVFDQAGGSDMWDFGQTNYSDTFTLEAGMMHHVVYEAINPVANLLPQEWKGSLANIAPLTSSPTQWWDDYPIYIRNDMMQHLVELGNILRMEPFSDTNPEIGSRTLNLVDYKYNGDPETPGHYAEDTDGIIDDMVGDLLDGEGNGGDRNLLDMVRLGTNDIAERQISGRININTQRREVLEGLFKRVPSLLYSEETAGDRPIPTAEIDTLITNILNKTAATPIPVGIYSNFRNPPIYGLLFQDDMTSLPKHAREHLLLLTRQMITAEHNFFTALVTAQVIRDVGGINEDVPIRVFNPITGSTSEVQARYGRYDPGADKILAEAKILAVLYRNAFTNRVVIERFHFLED